MEKQHTLRRVLGFLKPYWFWLLASLILAVATVALTLYIPCLLYTSRCV